MADFLDLIKEAEKLTAESWRYCLIEYYLFLKNRSRSKYLNLFANQIGSTLKLIVSQKNPYKTNILSQTPLFSLKTTYHNASYLT